MPGGPGINCWASGESCGLEDTSSLDSPRNLLCSLPGCREVAEVSKSVLLGVLKSARMSLPTLRFRYEVLELVGLRFPDVEGRDGGESDGFG